MPQVVSGKTKILVEVEYERFPGHMGDFSGQEKRDRLKELLRSTIFEALGKSTMNSHFKSISITLAKSSDQEDTPT